MTKIGVILAGFGLVWALFGCSSPALETSVQGKTESPNLPAEVTLRLKAKKGDRYVLKQTVEMSAELPMPDGSKQTATMTASGLEENECIEIKDGKMTWREKNLEVSAQGTGPFEAQAANFVKTEKDKVNTEVRDEFNRIIKSDEPDHMPFEYPSKPIKPGDEWTTEGKMFDAPSKATYKVESIARVDGRLVIVILIDILENSNIRNITPLKAVIDVETGWEIENSGEVEMSP